MSDTRDRWSKFYWDDWRSDPQLRMCSFAARGLWVDLLGIMHQATPQGHLLIGGKAPTRHQLAAILGASLKELGSMMSELEAAGVPEIIQGIWVSRRMVRDAARRDTNRANGRAGGNPKLREPDQIAYPSRITEPDNLADNRLSQSSDNPSDKPRARGTEADTDTEAERAPHKSPLPIRARSSATLNATELAAFDRWYERYPHKVGRGDAERKFKIAFKANPNILDAIVPATEAYIRRLAEPNAPPPCNPATWLDQRRWEDQPIHVNGHADHDRRVLTPDEMAICREAGGIFADKANHGGMVYAELIVGQARDHIAKRQPQAP